MPDTARILFVQAPRTHAEAAVGQLRGAGADVVAERHDGPGSLRAAVEDGAWDAVVLEGSPAGADLSAALEAIRNVDECLAVVVVSSPAPPETIAAAMRAGADDWVDVSDPGRLHPAVRGAIERAEGRRRCRQAERDLAAAAAARQRYEFIVNTSQDFMTLVRKDYVYEAANEAYCTAMGKTADEVVGRTVAEIWGRETFESVIHERLANCFAGQIVQYEEWFEFGELGRRYFHVRCYPYRGSGAEVTHAVVISRDITERKRMEEELARAVRQRTAELEQTTIRLDQLQRELRRGRGIEGIVGRSAGMVRLYEIIRDVAEVNVPVLIEGESGTGKELVANAIRTEGPRRDKPFVAVNCGALPEGLLESELFGHVEGAFTGAVRARKGRFELADGGTIFLDEVAELPPTVQVKLLRVLQEGTFEPVGSEASIHVDVRVISATNRDLRAEVAAGRFRKDLFYRLAVVPIHVPPLRSRQEDIPLLADHILRRHVAAMGREPVTISDEAMRVLLAYPWPGNVRELENALQYALVRCRGGELLAEHLPPTVTSPTAGPPAAAPSIPGPGRLTPERIRRALEQTGGNKVRAARLLGVSRATLYRHLARHGLNGPAGSPD